MLKVVHSCPPRVVQLLPPVFHQSFKFIVFQPKLLTSQLRHSGQWLEPAAGSTFNQIYPEPLEILFDTRNLSNQDETSWSPPLLLFHVNQPSPVSMSTKELWVKISLNSSWYLSNTLLPPFFSLRAEIRLKSPPTIHLPSYAWLFNHLR